ncbi:MULTISPECIES: virulence factor TspB C-terminal domain-related protein [Acinetobacter calcoaceticus/baumannii complex]|uniref:virulence factor TspB C-terminal domain-related protein n=1 Tax=Acinetobacter calcoaceticus/baumannii complex TaxID=909768 RepID=UPI0002895A19
MCFNIVLAPTYVFATTVAADGWSVTKRIVQGATTFYDGTKNIVLNGKNYAATGAAAITPTATQVSKMIVRTGAVLAVDLAIKALIGAVDYTMDPANNRVKYFLVSDPTDPNDPSSQYYYYNAYDGINYATASQACQGMLTHPDYKTFKASLVSQSRCELYRPDGTYFTYYTMYKAANPAYDPNAEPNRQEKYLPYDAVASQVISDAVAEKSDAKAYVSSVADTALDSDESRQIVGADQVVQQLNASQSIPTSNTATGQAAVQPTTDPATGEPTATPPPYDITINFPEACSWMPSICSGLQSVVNYLNGFNTWLNEFGKDTSLPDNEKPEFETQSISPTENYISWAASCPPDAHVPVELYGTHSTITFSWAPWCELLSIIKPAIVFSAYMGAAFIVLGLRT